MAEFTAITTQEQLDSVIGDRLRRSEEKWQKKYEGYLSKDDVENLTSDLKKQVSDLTESLNSAKESAKNHDKEIAERDAKIKGFELSATKQRIAHEVGLSYDAIGYLSGEDEESIMKSAEGLKALMGTSTHSAPAFENIKAEAKNKENIEEGYLKMAKSFK